MALRTEILSQPEIRGTLPLTLLILAVRPALVAKPVLLGTLPLISLILGLKSVC